MFFLQVLAQFSEKLHNLATLIGNVVDFEESKHLKRLAVLQGKGRNSQMEEKESALASGQGLMFIRTQSRVQICLECKM
jgi:hypothetical protein